MSIGRNTTTALRRVTWATPAAIATALLCAGPLVGCDESVCGNGSLESGEQCDDGNLVGGDGCDSMCGTELGWECSSAGCSPVCGDGRLVAGEVCDPGITSGVYCSSTCDEVFGECGDGVLYAVREDCDPGTTLVRGCSNCQELFGFTCAGAPVECTAADLPGDLLMNSLDITQREALCAWLIDTLGGPGAVYVCDTYEFTNYSVSQCVDNLPTIAFGSCTVADIEDHMADSGTRCGWSLSGDPDCI